MKILRKGIIYTLLIALSFSFNIEYGDAASASVSISSNSNTVVVGNTVTYTVRVSSGTPLGSLVYSVNYDSSKLTPVSGTLNDIYLIQNNTTKSTTFTFRFKAKASGTANISFVLNDAIDFDGNSYSVNKTTTKSIKIITQAELEASYSKNNYLSSLSVDGYSLTPTFNKDVSEYSLTLENDVKSINITGSVEDSKSSVTGLGTKELVEGSNKIEINVTAQNGSTRSYIINATVKELSPIVVEVNGNSYNVVRKKELISAPNSKYQETTISINDEEVPAFYNDTTDVTLVGLRDSNENIELYSYDDGTYTLYKEFVFNKIIITEEALTSIPTGYKETKVTINENELTAYQNDDSSNFYLLYARNIETGLINLYQYDSKENTIQLFNEKEKENAENKAKLYEYVIIGLGSLLAITYVCLLVSTIKKGKKTKNNKKTKKNDNVSIDKTTDDSDIELEEIAQVVEIDTKSDEETDSFTQIPDKEEVYLEETTQIVKNDDRIEEDISYKKRKKTTSKHKKK